MGADTIQPIGSSSDVKMVNQQGYDQINNQLQSFLSNPGANNPYLSQSAGALSQMSLLSGNYNNFMEKLFGSSGLSKQLETASKEYDPQAGFNLYLNRQPELANIASGLANRALTERNDSARSLAQRTANQAMGNVAGQLGDAGLLGSGAAVGAMTEAALTPTMQAENELSGIRAGYLGNLDQMFNSQAMSQFQGAYDQDRNSLMNGLLAQAGLIDSGAGMLTGQLGALGNVASGYGNLANLFGSNQANALGNLAQLNQPEYWQPQYMTIPGSSGNWGGVAAGGLAGASAGATIGSLIPGLGTAVGAGVGGLIGGIGGWFS